MKNKSESFQCAKVSQEPSLFYQQVWIKMLFTNNYVMLYAL